MSTNIVDNEEWQRYVRENLEPINELVRGKLGQEGEVHSESDNNIFDADFMSGITGRKDDDLMRADPDMEESKEDHKKFMQSIQKAFSSNNGFGRNKTDSFVEDNERNIK